MHVQAHEELAYYDGSHARTTGEEQAETMHQRLVLDGGKDSSNMPDRIPTPEEPTVKQIHNLARNGISKIGHHDANCAMIVLRKGLPHRDDIQILAGKKATKYLLDNQLGRRHGSGRQSLRKSQLMLEFPLFVSNMSFSAFNKWAKASLARGEKTPSTGIFSSESGMLPEEQQAKSRYCYELISIDFGYKKELITEHVREVASIIPIGFKLLPAQGRVCATLPCAPRASPPRARNYARSPRSTTSRLTRFLQASTKLMQVVARTCGHDDLDQFSIVDLSTRKHEMAEFSGFRFAGVGMDGA